MAGTPSSQTISPAIASIAPSAGVGRRHFVSHSPTASPATGARTRAVGSLSLYGTRRRRRRSDRRRRYHVGDRRSLVRHDRHDGTATTGSRVLRPRRSLAAFAFGGFEAGVRATLLEETPYSIRVADCDATGIRPRTFATSLGHSLVRQIDIHFETGSPWRFHANPRETVDRLSVLFDGLDQVSRRLGEARTSSAGVSLSPTTESSPTDPETPAGHHRPESSTDFDASREPGHR